jgi:hypothetical protein
MENLFDLKAKIQKLQKDEWTYSEDSLESLRAYSAALDDLRSLKPTPKVASNILEGTGEKLAKLIATMPDKDKLLTFAMLLTEEPTRTYLVNMFKERGVDIEKEVADLCKEYL